MANVKPMVPRELQEDAYLARVRALFGPYLKLNGRIPQAAA
jgi:hypothetical protein